MVSVEELNALGLRVGKILEVEDLAGARGPMYRLKVDLGVLGIRSLVAGLKDIYSREELIGRQIIVVSNMEPKKIANFISEGMLLAAQDGDTVSLLVPDKELTPGSAIR